MAKKEMVIRRIDVEVLKEFLQMYVPDAEVIIHNDGIEIEHEGFSWSM
jgi:hypothetical protein